MNRSSLDRSSRPSQLNKSGVQQNRSNYQSQRQSAVQDRQSVSSSNKRDLQGNRQDWKDQNREDWQDYGQNRQEDRQDYGQARQEDRQDYANRYNNRYYDGWYGYNHYENWNNGAAFATGLVIGATLSAAAFSSAYPSGCVSSNFGGVAYYNCGTNWYQRVYRGGNVTYIVVNQPY